MPVTAPHWCHGLGDYLQVDQKSMYDYKDVGSPQNRFCGTNIPYTDVPFKAPTRTGGSCYISDSETLLLQMKTNSDTTVGTGFELNWEEVAIGTKCV